MNSRERILAAIRHRQPDRIPVDLGATPSSGISVVAWHNLARHMGMKDAACHVYDVIQEVAQPGMDLLGRFNVDVLDIGRYFNSSPGYWQPLEIIKGCPGMYPGWFNPRRQPDGSWLAEGKTGEDIAKMPAGATFFDQLIFPYLDEYPAGFSNLEHDMARVSWGGFGFPPFDRIDEKDFWKTLRSTVAEERSKTDKALLIGVGCNLFEWGTFLRRIDNFLTDLYLDPANVHRFLDRLLEMHMAFLVRVCESVGDLVDIIKFGDDLGTNTGPFMPPEIYREFFRHRHRTMCDFVKSHSGAHTMLHCCGGIYELIPELIDAGFEIINPVQINAVNMEPSRLKGEFGKDVTFWGGGINTQSVLNHASPKHVKEHVFENLGIFFPGGGFVFAAVHNIMPDVPPQNIIAMYEAIEEFNGRL